MTSKTTPTPWRVEAGRFGPYVCAERNGTVIVAQAGRLEVRGEAEANASLIVKAVNEREGLLRALERLSVAAVSDPFATPPGELGWTTESVRAANKELDEAINQARALLSQARNEKP